MSKQNIEEDVRRILGMSGSTLQESYVTAAKKYDVTSELLSEKSKIARQKEYEKCVETLNKVSAQLDSVNRQEANRFSSDFRSLKAEEAHLLTSSFLKAYHFENISDLKSQIAVDSICFMRLERDFGSFDDWQKDFIACGMSSRNGFVVTAYNFFLRRYMNFIVDNQSSGVPVSCVPVIVLDVSEGAYYRDYVDDRKSYMIAMMKEFDWEKIEDRFKQSDKMSKVMG
jgi:Fe-Mn family superoxide dismutase